MKYLAPLAFLALLGCQPAQDPVIPTRNTPKFELTVHLMTVEEAAKKCASYGVNDGIDNKIARGCALYYHDSNRCEVYAPRPEYLDDEHTRILGHEVLHCVAGRYHPVN